MRGLLEEIELRAVWMKAARVIGHDPDEVRQDDYGNIIAYRDYGDRKSRFGWEVDHIKPSAIGGGDHIGNKRPLHWHPNSSLGGILGIGIAATSTAGFGSLTPGLHRPHSGKWGR